MLGRREVRAWLAYAAALVIIAAFVYGRVISAPGDRVFAENDDSSLFIWWFAHAADVVCGWFGAGSGEHNFLYATSMNAPTGVNGGWNTTVLGLALPMVPVTLLCGPVVAYNICIVAAPIVSALAAAAFIRRFTGLLPAFAGGIAYGFSTYPVAQSAGHLNLAFAPFPPLVVLALISLSRSRTNLQTLRTGVLLGLLVGWQFYMSTEMLGGSFLAAVLFVLCWLIFDFRAFARGLRRLLAGGLIGVSVAALLGLPLVLTMATMPGAPRGPIRPHGVWNNDLLDPITPGAFTLFGGGEVHLDRVLPLDPAEIGGYFGILWLLLAAGTFVAAWRTRFRRIVLVTVTASALIWIASLGSPWYFAGRPLLHSGPFRLIESLPVLSNILPMRMAVHATLGMAVMLAIGLQLALESPRPVLRRGVGVLTVTALVAISPGTVNARDLTIPDFYRNGAAQAQIPRGALVKTLPRPVAVATPRADEAMLWQAVTGMHYRDTGGYFIGSSAAEPVTYNAPLDGLDELLEAHKEGPPPSHEELRSAIDALRRSGVEFIAVAPDGAFGPGNLGDIARELSAAAGVPYRVQDGVCLIDLRTS